MTYEWIIPVIALIITILIFTYSQFERKKIESARLTLNLTERLYEQDVKLTRKKISSCIDLKKDLVIVSASIETPKQDDHFKITGRDLEEYLNELEQIGLFVNKGVLDEKFAYEMFGFQFVEVWEYKIINDYIINQRKQYQKDLWNQFEKAYKIFKPLQNKQKESPLIKKFSKNK